MASIKQYRIAILWFTLMIVTARTTARQLD